MTTAMSLCLQGGIRGAQWQTDNDKGQQIMGGLMMTMTEEDGSEGGHVWEGGETTMRGRGLWRERGTTTRGGLHYSICSVVTYQIYVLYRKYNNSFILYTYAVWMIFIRQKNLLKHQRISKKHIIHTFLRCPGALWTKIHYPEDWQIMALYLQSAYGRQLPWMPWNVPRHPRVTQDTLGAKAIFLMVIFIKVLAVVLCHFWLKYLQKQFFWCLLSCLHLVRLSPL